MKAASLRNCCGTKRGQDIPHEENCHHAIAEAMRLAAERRRAYAERAVYFATHPETPNLWDGRARGRVLHIAAEPKKTRGRRLTLCAMRITEKFTLGGREVCTNCVRLAERADNKRPPVVESPTADSKENVDAER